MSRVITLIAAAHLGHFRNLDEIATAKAEIFEGIEPGGTALINRDDSRWKLLDKLARAAGVEHIMGFGEPCARRTSSSSNASPRRTARRSSPRSADAKSRRASGRPDGMSSRMRWPCSGPPNWSAPMSHKVAAALATLTLESGRGRRHELALPGGTLGLIDESYNANPASMKAALELLDGCTGAWRAGGGSPCSAICWNSATMPPSCMPGLPGLINGKNIDLVLLAGPEMKALAEKLADGPKIEYRANVDELKPVLMDTVRAGDTVMIKSSKGVGFSKLVDALTNQFPAQAVNAKRA